MVKFHINTKTGEPGACQAAQGKCPFGGVAEHYTSKQAAREAFEELKMDSILNTASKSKISGATAAKVVAKSQATLTTAPNSEDMANSIFFEGPLDSMGLQSYNYSVNHFILDEQRAVFNLNPPYQRGSVWEVARKQNLIRSILLGIPIGAIAMNKNMISSKSGSVYDVIDGKQRIETIRDFADSKFPIPSSWVLPTDIVSTVEVDGWPVPGVIYSGLSTTFGRVFKMRPMAAVESSYKSYAEQAEIFRLINTGGVGQTTGSLANAASVENTD